MTEKTEALRRAVVERGVGGWDVKYYHDGEHVGSILWDDYTQAVHQALLWTRQVS
jgi:hypothetical protein